MDYGFVNGQIISEEVMGYTVEIVTKNIAEKGIFQNFCLAKEKKQIDILLYQKLPKVDVIYIFTDDKS